MTGGVPVGVDDGDGDGEDDGVGGKDGEGVPAGGSVGPDVGTTGGRAVIVGSTRRVGSSAVPVVGAPGVGRPAESPARLSG